MPLFNQTFYVLVPFLSLPIAIRIVPNPIIRMAKRMKLALRVSYATAECV